MLLLGGENCSAAENRNKFAVFKLFDISTTQVSFEAFIFTFIFPALTALNITAEFKPVYTRDNLSVKYG